MANKVSVLVACVFLVAAIHHVHKAEGGGLDEFASCFNTCDKECQYEGFGRTFCEMKCDADCVAKETRAKFDKLSHPNP
uniref:Major pollen allergen Ole e 6-like n=1 Tax=Kalanchoe fedtschenkoi TaxID=63787 RepID=A0A7N0TFD7_KALFE